MDILEVYTLKDVQSKKVSHSLNLHVTYFFHLCLYVFFTANLDLVWGFA